MSQPQNQSFLELLNNRYSVRGFLDKTIPSDELKTIFEQAQQAPSNCNTQPWQAYVVSGERCKQLAEKLSTAVAGGLEAKPDYDVTLGFYDEFRQRQVDCAYALYGSMGIERGDKPGRGMAMLRNFQFFDAPHVAFIAMPKTFGIVNTLDVGIYLQSLILSMEAHGVGSCIQGALAYYPNFVREALDIEDDTMQILCGVSFGYEDTAHPANKTRTVRAPLAENIQFFE